jgi:hypothetical protein
MIIKKNFFIKIFIIVRLCVFVKNVYEKYLKRSNIIRRLIIVIIRVLNNIISNIFNKNLKKLNYFYQRQCDKNNHFYLTPYFVFSICTRTGTLNHL